ncbi:hypothetical protein [Stomatohabitans albus]|uniref:hypothetical protein n=1 Tax=Stomatohabitans albus TaxID=3110766 RepID=UPI00300D44CC
MNTPFRPHQIAILLSALALLAGCSGTDDIATTTYQDKSDAITYPDQIEDDAITYPDDIKSDDAITYPDDIKSDDAITYPDREPKPNRKEGEDKVNTHIIVEGKDDMNAGEDELPFGFNPSEVKDTTAAKNLKDEHALSIDTLVVKRDNKLRLIYIAGDDKCYGHRPVVKETDKEVMVGLVEGHREDAPEACRAILMVEGQTVDLEKPVGDRKVVLLPEKEVLKVDKEVNGK